MWHTLSAKKESTLVMIGHVTDNIYNERLISAKKHYYFIIRLNYIDLTPYINE